MATKESKAADKEKSDSLLKKAIELKNEGNKFFIKDKYQEALDYYTRAIEVCPKDKTDELSKMYHNRAASYEKLKNFKQVVKECTVALQLNPTYQKAILRRSKAAAKTEEFELAIEDLCSLCIMEKYSNFENIMSSQMLIKIFSEKLCEERINSFKPIAVTKCMVDELLIGYTKDPVYNNQQFFNQLELESASNPDEANEMYKAVKEFDNENYDKCIEHCTNEIKNKGKYMNEARNLRGSLYHLKLQYAEAIMDFNEVSNNPKASNRVKANALAKMPQSMYHFSEYTKERVISIFNKAIELDPKNDDIYLARAGLLPQMDDMNYQSSDFETAIRLNPNNKFAHINKACFDYMNFFYDIVKKGNAHLDSNEVVHLPPKAKRQVEKASLKVEPLLKRFNDIAEPFRQYANILHEQRNYEEADKYYKMAIEREPKNGKLYAKLAWNHMVWKEEDYDTPFKILTKAIEIEPSCEEAFHRFSKLEFKNRKFQHAAELFSKNIDLQRQVGVKRQICSMYIVAKTQQKMVQKFGKEASHLNLN